MGDFMYYKLMNNNILADLLTEVCYVRYLSKQKRWVITDPFSANGVRASDGNTIYHLEGTLKNFEDDLVTVSLVEINKEEYDKLSNLSSQQAKENLELTNRINNLEATLAQQSALLEAILAKM